MKQRKWTDLVLGASAYMKSVLEYKDSSISTYNQIWQRVKMFMIEMSARYYNKDVESKFLQNEFNGRERSSLRRWEKRKYYVVKALTQFQETGMISYVHREIPELIFDGKVGQSMIRFFQFVAQENHFSAGYTARLKNHLHHFLEFCNERKITEPESLTGYVVVQYFETGQVRDHNMPYSLRFYFDYLFRTGILPSNYKSRIPKFKRKDKKLQPVYNQAEVNKIISSNDRSTISGKRDYAITVLAARLGMRISDIVGLKLTDINWNRNEIYFIQKKTGVPRRLPFGAQVGNAIIEYVQFARPISKDPHVFVKSKPPHVAYKYGLCISKLIERIYERSGVPANGRHRGGHALRHSFAQALMDAGVPMIVIMEILGHSTLESTNSYTRPNLKAMSRYGLPVRIVNDNFYGQEGGKFYA